MKCLNSKCNQNHDGTFGSGKFCSRNCANSRTLDYERISATLRKKYKSGELKSNWPKLLKRVDIQIKRKASLRDYHLRLKNLPFEEKSIPCKKEYIWEKFGNNCTQCSFAYTDSKSLKGPFEIHHIDGNHNNWSEENLTVLCLNCHWKTPNWRFRNRRHSEESKAKIGQSRRNHSKNCSLE